MKVYSISRGGGGEIRINFIRNQHNRYLFDFYRKQISFVMVILTSIIVRIFNNFILRRDFIDKKFETK